MFTTCLLTNFTVGMKYSGGLANSRAFPGERVDDEGEGEGDLTKQRQREGTLDVPEVLLFIKINLKDGK